MCKNFQMNLYDDWLNQLSTKLTREGYDVSNMKKSELPYKYFNMLNKKLVQIPRQVLISKELYQSPYYNKYKKVINYLKSLIEKGEDISAYLSKKIDSIDYNDGLLNDWGIHHLHLSTEKESNSKFNKRTGELLFVRFQNTKAYFINIYKHNNWAKKEVIQIVHRNCEEDFRTFRLEGVLSLHSRIEDRNYQKLRNKNINVPIEVEEGVVYMGFGFGITTSGHGQLAMLEERRCKKALKRAEEYINHEMVMKDILGKKIYFYPIFHNEYLSIIDLYTMKKVYCVKYKENNCEEQ